MSNKLDPAFPAINSENTFYEPGISKLEFFACNAPGEIPGWFNHVAPEEKQISAPDVEDVQDAEDRKTVRSWVNDPCFDLPDHLKWFSDKYTEANSEYYQWLHKDKEARYFQWRRYYAEQLLLELSKTRP